MLTPGLYLVTPDQADGDALVAAVAALLPARPPPAVIRPRACWPCAVLPACR